MISNSSHSATGPLNSSATISTGERSGVGSTTGASGVSSTGSATGAASNTNGGAPFIYNPSRGHPNFNPTKPVVAINRTVVSIITKLIWLLF